MVYGFFGFMIIALLLSMFIGYIGAIRTQKLRCAILGSVSTNAVVIAIASYWWFHTATDGLAQGLGVAYYGAAFVVISFINIILFVRLNRGDVN